MIDSELIFSILDIQTNSNSVYSGLGLSNTSEPNSLSFLDDENYLDQLNANPHITGVICSSKMAPSITKETIVVEDARYAFYTMHNYIAELFKSHIPSEIDESVLIGANCYVHDQNVKIGKNTVIQPNVTILGDVEIGENCFIQSGTVIGSEGYEYKRTSKGIIAVKHDGSIIIGNNVHIGANTCIDKGFSFRKTIIEDEVKIDNLIHVAHGVQIKEGSFIIAGTILGGSCTIEANSWLSINSSLAPGITVKKNGFVSIGAVVTKNVNENEQVTGNFAIPHDQFISNFKDSLKKNKD